MKKLTSLFKVALTATMIIVILILAIRNNVDADSLSVRVKDYESRADSLRLAVKVIDVSVHQKDSILLVYLASLGKTLEELNKESLKNKKSIELNFLKQDSVRKAYCREMARLEQHPEECQ